MIPNELAPASVAVSAVFDASRQAVDAAQTSAEASRQPARPDPALPLLPILVNSLVLHLLIVGFLGAGVPKAPPPRPRTITPPQPSNVQLLEDIKLEPEPQPQPAERPSAEDTEVLATENIPVAADVALPPLAQVEPIAAVPASVPVAFGIAVKGPVRLVSDASAASGAVGGRARSAPIPISLDSDVAQGKNLLLEPIAYPPESVQRQETGVVVVEFRTSPTGDILDAQVRQESGYPRLDRAALNNLRRGRFAGPVGYYLKRFVFRLN